MARRKILSVVSLVLFAAGVAVANNLLTGPSPGLVGSGAVVAQTTTPSTTTTTPATVGPSTGMPTSAVTPSTTGTTTATTGITTTAAAATTPTSSVAATTLAALPIEQIVSITRSVAAGSPVTAFTVPAGQQLIVTDVLITNPGTTPACGAAIIPSGAATVTTAAGTTTTTGTGESGTGVLCIPAQTSLDLGLTTGLEFAAGQGVVLANTSTATGTTPAATLHYHLRGFLVSPGT